MLLVIAITIHQQFGAESFSHHNFNRTKILLHSLALNLNSTDIENKTGNRCRKKSSDFFCFLKTPEHDPDTSTSTSYRPTVVALEQQYKDKMEDFRRDLLETIPEPLRNFAVNSRGNPNHSEFYLDAAMAFLEDHARPDKNDWKQTLERYVALKEALEAFQTAKSPIDQGLIKQLMDGNPVLLEEMLLADGPSGGNYGRAMEIYEEIFDISDCVHDTDDHPILHKMALAISLVHATPVAQTNILEPEDNDDCDDSNGFVDPIARYLNYEVAYLDGELDPNFDTLTAWELRFVVDGDETDEMAAWGRTTLRNFYPDHTFGKDDWRYTDIVRTDVPYGSSRVKEDDPKLHKYQNILRNGGICGRRAFFGRFILRAFGIPTTARPSKGHAALVHWTPSGKWVVNLGGGWGKGWTNTRYGRDQDFEATTKARNHPKAYHKVKLAQWIGDLFNEKRVYGIYDPNGKQRKGGALLDLKKKSVVGLWYRLSLKIQESILADNNGGAAAPARIAMGDPVSTIVETARQEKVRNGKCHCMEDGHGKTTIRIPASSYADPRDVKDAKIMKMIENPNDEDRTSPVDEFSSNRQIHLQGFSIQGTTIMRGGCCGGEAKGHCNSGRRLKSGGYGHYKNWGFRAAMSLDGCAATASFPEPEITLTLSGDDNDNTPVTMEFVYIPPGKFVMGGMVTDREGDERFTCKEFPHHPVEFTKGFYLGKYPVTQDQYGAVQKGSNPSKSTQHPKCPVENIDIDNATLFCQVASDVTGSNIRLPTEAEWEYAARGNTASDSADPRCFFGDESQLDDYAWNRNNSGGMTHPVGLKKANPFGIYDIYGNVNERVSDTYAADYYAQGKGEAMVNPTGPSQGVKCAIRYEVKNVPVAGEYFLTAWVCTVTARQRLKVSTSEGGGVDEGTILKLPYTVGDWKESEPVTLQLKEGDNTLHFWRDDPPQYGVSIREFVLTLMDRARRKQDPPKKQDPPIIRDRGGLEP